MKLNINSVLDITKLLRHHKEIKTPSEIKEKLIPKNEDIMKKANEALQKSKEYMPKFEWTVYEAPDGTKILCMDGKVIDIKFKKDK